MAVRGFGAAIVLAVVLAACGDGERVAFIESKCSAVAAIESAYDGCADVAGHTYDELKKRR
jgi:hypothetical protein